MAYRWQGVECDTYEELLRLQAGRKETKPASASSPTYGICHNPNHRDDCRGSRSDCGLSSICCCGKGGDCSCDRM